MKGNEDDTPAPKYLYAGTGGQGKRDGGWDAKGYTRFSTVCMSYFASFSIFYLLELLL